MPGMNGVEVCRLIKSQEKSKGVEVLAMTAYPGDGSIDEVLEMGAKVCLTKPLDLDLMLKEIEAAL